MVFTETLTPSTVSVLPQTRSSRLQRQRPVAAPARLGLLDNPQIREQLEKIVCSFACDHTLRQDLMQEALVHAWQIERERPGQTGSWYLQSCRFRLQHYLAAGRSIDSRKRGSAQVLSFSDDEESTAIFEQLQAEQDHVSDACTRDLLSKLSSCLKPQEQAVLDCLADGLGTCDIVRKLGLSGPTVNKYRRNIARLAVKFGIDAPV